VIPEYNWSSPFCSVIGIGLDRGVFTICSGAYDLSMCSYQVVSSAVISTNQPKKNGADLGSRLSERPSALVQYRTYPSVEFPLAAAFTLSL